MNIAPPTLPSSPLPSSPLSSIPLLAVRNLCAEFRTRSGTVSALENISFYINPSETVGIVGESGSGKSVLALTIMGILDPAGHVTAGEILWSQSAATLNLLNTPEKVFRQLRGKDLSMIFSKPTYSP